MAEKLKGETRFEALGRVWRMQFSVNGICALEDAVGTGMQEFLSELAAATTSGRMRMGDVRRLFWAGLVEHQDDIDVRTAGKIITDLGGIEAAQEIMEQALTAAFPEGGDKGDGDKAAAENPPPG